ncbi:MAG TPA: hypothetical protein VMD08_05700 [Candidatus Baltobacteraceae bacterium]|nr:hypothetical protein [Candidatus Baltobacteraceae bacterium]
MSRFAVRTAARTLQRRWQAAAPDGRKMPRVGVAMLLGILLAGSAAGQFPAIGMLAPERTGSPWVSSEPLSLQSLRGRVVLVDFWTVG